MSGTSSSLFIVCEWRAAAVDSAGRPSATGGGAPLAAAGTAAFAVAAGVVTGRVTACVFGLSDPVHAATTTTAETAITTSTTRTTFVSIRRLRRCGWTLERRGR